MEWHWRNSMKTVRFFAFDAKAAGPFMLFIMHIRLWTFLLFIFSLFLFWTLEKRGLSFGSALRAFRIWLIGAKRPAVVFTKKQRMKDTGSA